MNEVNFDEELLLSLKVDSSYDEPILNQVLRISLYDEYHAYETYRKIIDNFGNFVPFTNIIRSEQMHIDAIMKLCDKYQVPPPVNNWYDKIELPDTILECCEVGVVAEIDNIKMYDNLLIYIDEYPDIKDIFFRLQAASFNNHLPAFRKCVLDYSQSLANSHESYLPPQQKDIGQKINEINNIVGKFATGDINQDDILKILGNTNLSFIGGALIGAFGAMMISGNKSQEK